jgi:TonB family protein
MKASLLILTLLLTSVVFGANITQRDSLPQGGGYDSLIVMPTPIVSPAPAYPKAARNKGIEGTVWTEVLVGINGSVLASKVIKNASASKELEKAALAAVEHWRFKPATKENKPVEVRVTIPFRFKLDKDEKHGKK